MKIVFLGALLGSLMMAGCSKQSGHEYQSEQDEKDHAEAKHESTAAITDDKRNVSEKMALVVDKKSKEKEDRPVPQKFPAESLKRGFASPTTGRKIEDRIVARVNGENILLSDLNEPRVDKDGALQSLDEAIAESLLIHKGFENKLNASELDVEKRIVNWKEQIGFGDKPEEAFEQWIKEKVGLTLKRAKRQVRRMLLAQQVSTWLLSDKGFIAPKRVKEYYEKNPAYQEERYNLRSAFVDADDIENGAVKEGVELEWVDLGWLDYSALSERMKFIASMAQDEMSKPLANDQGYQIIKLLDREKKRLKTFEEREVEITKLLESREIEKAEQVLINQLKDKASIVYLDPL